MPASKSRAALKAALLAPAGTIVAWGVQQALSGDGVAGVTAIVIGTLFIGGYVVLQEYDLPYEDEIVEIIKQNRDALSEDSVKDISKEVSEAASERGIELPTDSDDDADETNQTDDDAENGESR